MPHRMRNTEKDRKIIREQLSLLMEHVDGPEIDFAFVRLHALAIYQHVAERSEIFQIIKGSPAFTHAVVRTAVGSASAKPGHGPRSKADGSPDN